MNKKTEQLLRDFFKWLRPNSAFVVTMTSLFLAGVLAFYKGADINTLIPTILGLYLGQKASTTVSAHVAAAKDPKCDTRGVINDLAGTRAMPDIQPDNPDAEEQ